MSLHWKLKRSLDRALALLMLGGLASSLAGCYVGRLAYHQNNLFNSRQLIAGLLRDSNTPAPLQKKLVFLEKVKAYATVEGLNAEGAYRYYIDTKEPYVSYSVQAAQVDRLESLTWWFPVVGRVPYLGFFYRDERDAKAEELANEGYDVFTGEVGAYSSLGWFEDPIYSPMLAYAESSFASLIFHELTHRTLWIPGEAKFNENLASFAEVLVTRKFLSENKEDKELHRYEQKLRDKKLYKGWLNDLKKALESLYAHPPASGRAALLKEKAAVFHRFTIDKKPRFELIDYVGKKEHWNNATVLGASLYSPDIDRFAKAYDCSKAAHIGEFLTKLQQAWDKQTGDDPFAALDSLCHG